MLHGACFPGGILEILDVKKMKAMKENMECWQEMKWVQCKWDIWKGLIENVTFKEALEKEKG